jgi:hypothetical protein
MATVHGRVTLDGRPLELVDVVFQPTNKEPPSTGLTNADGYYELLYKRGVNGARLGEYNVRIGFFSNLAKNPPKIPARYNTNSEQNVEVKSGPNEYNFDVKSEEK